MKARVNAFYRPGETEKARKTHEHPEDTNCPESECEQPVEPGQLSLRIELHHRAKRE